MQHSAIIKKGEDVTIYSYTNSEDPYIDVWKFTDDNEFIKLNDVYIVYELNLNYHRCTFQSPNEDCFLCIKFGDYPTFIRVGNPKVRLLHYSDNINDTITFKQIDLISGSILGTGNLINLGHGFYYRNLSIESYSILEIQNSFGYVEPNILKLPYSTGSEVISGSGYFAERNFLDVGLNTIGFLGQEKSTFDLGQGKWIESSNTAKASDLAKAVCFKYGLEWNRTVPSGQEHLQPLWVGNYIKYIKTQDEETGRLMTYRPFVTPETNTNNFMLITYDELDNVQVKGLLIMLYQSLETLDEGSSGAIFDFT